MGDENQDNTHDGATGLMGELSNFVGDASSMREAMGDAGDKGQSDDNSNPPNPDRTRLENPNISLDDFAKDLGNNRSDVLKNLKIVEGDDKDKSKEAEENKGVDDKDKSKDDGQRTEKDADDKAKQSKDKDKKEPTDDDKRVDDADDGFKNRRQSEGRDVTGYTEQVATWLKRMPLEAYQFFNKQLREKAEFEKGSKEKLTSLETKVKTLEEGKQVLPENYYEHPESVVLTQDFKELQSTLTLASQIEQHWEQQLIAVSKLKDGEESVIYKLTTDKEGNYFIDDKNPIKVDDENKAQLLITLQKYARDTGQQTANVRGQLNQLIETHGNRHKEYVSKLAAAEDKYMPWFKDEKSDEYKYFDAVAKQLPAQGISKNNPLFNMLAKSIAMNIMLRDVIASGKTNANKDQRIKEQQRRGGPTGADFTGGDIKGGGKGRITSVNDFTGLPAIKV